MKCQEYPTPPPTVVQNSLPTLLSNADFVFQKKKSRNTIRVSNTLVQDQAQCFVGSDGLGPNSLL